MAGVEIATIDGDVASLEADSIAAFRLSLRGPLLDPSHPEYDETRSIWNGMMDKRPALIARCRGTADVISAVNFAREHNLLLAVRGGGHNVAGYSSCDGGLMLDLSLMRGVRVDAENGTVRAQGGATLGDVDSEGQAFGLAVPAGVVSTTGVGGLTLGGGTGWQTRKRALTIDNLLSVDIVTADGQARVANKIDHSDLFWAVRGGGGNFGVVTSFEYQAYPVGPTVWVCAPFYPMDMGREVVRAFRDFMADAPPELGAALLFWSIPANEKFPEEHHGKPTVVPFLVHIGDLEEGDRLTRPLRALGEPLCDHSQQRRWSSVPGSLQTLFDRYVPKGTLQYYWKNLFLDSVEDSVLDHLVDIAETIPSKYTYLVLQSLAGPMNDVGSEETAFGARDIDYMFELDCMWSDPDEAEENISWSRKHWGDLQRYSQGLYSNFPGFGEEGEELARAAVRDANFERLAEVKAEYDPHNLFRLNQNIPPAR